MPTTNSLPARAGSAWGAALLLMLGLGLSACSELKSTANKYLPDKKVAYKSSTTAPDLEFPPQLHTPTTYDDVALPPGGEPATYSDYAARPEAPRTARAEAVVLPEATGVALQRDGDLRWLLVDEDADSLWPKLHAFWLQQGLLLTQEDPRTGIMETDWAENRADIPDGPVRNLIGKVIDSAYSAATRDKYRMRLERGETPGTTQIYVTHYGLKEVIVAASSFGDTGTTVWEPRPGDPELAAEILNRLMVYLGVEEEKAERALAAGEAYDAPEPPRSRLVQGPVGAPMLLVDEGFSRSWREVGLALDQVGFAVEDRDRSEGVYYVRYRDPLKDARKKGILDKLKFWGDDEPAKDDEYQIRLDTGDEGTEVTVHNALGEPDTTSTAKRILTLIHEQLQ